MKISLVITNWNGLDLLQKNLPTVLLNSPEVSDIIIADDGSEDDSVNYIRKMSQKDRRIHLFCHRHNQGFSLTSNHAVEKTIGDLVVMLNNDIVPHPHYIAHTLKHFKDPKVFGVGFSETDRNNYGKIFWKNGYLLHEPGYSSKSHISAWLSGGSAIVRKEYFQKLGGFDPVYSPFYYEDLDLGYRAWKSGHKLIWEPKSIVDHNHESTTSRFPKKFRNYVIERNQLMVIWRNITDPKMLSQNRFGILSRILSGPNYLKIFLAARRQMKLYPKSTIFPKLTDNQVFELFQN